MSGFLKAFLIFFAVNAVLMIIKCSINAHKDSKDDSLRNEEDVAEIKKGEEK